MSATLRNRLFALTALGLNVIVVISAYSWSSDGHGVPSVDITGWIALGTSVTPILVSLKVFEVFDLGANLLRSARDQLVFWCIVLAIEFLGAFISFLIITATFEFLWWALLQVASFLCLLAIFEPLRSLWHASRPADTVTR